MHASEQWQVLKIVTLKGFHYLNNENTTSLRHDFAFMPCMKICGAKSEMEISRLHPLGNGASNTPGSAHL